MADMDIDWDLISSYAGLLSLAGLSVYCGAFASLPTSAKKQDRASPSKRSLLYAEDDSDADEEDIPDRLSSGDAWLFPIIGSMALFGMYAVVKYFGKEWINWLLGWYFSIAGVGSVWRSMTALAKLLIGSNRWKAFPRNRFLFLRGPLEVFSISFRTPTLLLLPVALIPSVLYNLPTATRKSALLTDILALSFSHNALSVLKLDSFQTGCILLSGLFFYDIYWVFGTEVMVKVATSLDVPIKLLWPKSMSFTTERGFTMLGLGDVVIPGTFIALALRYDHARAQKTNGAFTTPFFLATLAAYVVGLIITMTVMHTFGKAQPALLYLSPACMLSFLVMAVARGELRDAWTWTDDPQELRETSGQEEGPVKAEVVPEVRNGDNASRGPADDAANGHAGVRVETTEGREEDEEGPSEQDDAKTKKKKSRGRKRA